MTDGRVLRNELDVVRREGYAIEDGELQLKVRAVAAPVRLGGDAVAALAVSGGRLDLVAAKPWVIQFADELSADLAVIKPDASL